MGETERLTGAYKLFLTAHVLNKRGYFPKERKDKVLNFVRESVAREEQDIPDEVQTGSFAEALEEVIGGLRILERT